MTSWNHSDVGSGTVVNQVQLTYDGFGNLLEDIQAVQGSVVTGTTPKVVYARSDGDGNSNGLESFAYPGGREITHQYGSSNSMSDWLSRLDTVYDSTSSF
ncbi:hypothetical protein JIN85_20380, partial [Luteolibacter pohnpeiensis]